jgi:predicted flap endonuclease-1-like 5' DNA nuclease
MSKLSDIEGIGASYAAKLAQSGIKTVEALLKACAAKNDRDKLAEKAGIPEKMLLKWANHADLFRIKGVGSEYSDLLEAAGVDTVPELALRKAENLSKKIAEVNDAKALVRKLPTQKQIADWIKQAAALPRVLKY